MRLWVVFVQNSNWSHSSSPLAAVRAGKQKVPRENKTKQKQAKLGNIIKGGNVDLSISSKTQIPQSSQLLYCTNNLWTIQHQHIPSAQKIVLTIKILLSCISTLKKSHGFVSFKNLPIKNRQLTSFLWKLLSCDSGERRGGEWDGTSRAFTCESESENMNLKVKVRVKVNMNLKMNLIFSFLMKTNTISIRNLFWPARKREAGLEQPLWGTRGRLCIEQSSPAKITILYTNTNTKYKYSTSIRLKCTWKHW